MTAIVGGIYFQLMTDPSLVDFAFLQNTYSLCLNLFIPLKLVTNLKSYNVSTIVVHCQQSAVLALDT